MAENDDLTDVAARHPGGRPSKRTPEIAARMLEAIRTGLSFKDACTVARISFPLFSKWRAQDQEFRTQIEAALAGRAESLLKTLTEAAKSDWRAALALLRIHDSDGAYTNKHRVEHQHLHLNADKVVIYLPRKENAPELPDREPEEIEDGDDD